MPPAAESGKPGPRICPALGLARQVGLSSRPRAPVLRRLPPGWLDGHGLPQTRLAATERIPHTREVASTNLSPLALHAPPQSAIT